MHRLLLLSFLAVVTGYTKHWASLKYYLDPVKDIGSDRIRLQFHDGPTVFAVRRENSSIYQGQCRVNVNSDSTVRASLLDVDYTQREILMNLKPKGNSHLKMTTDEYRLNLVGSISPYNVQTYYNAKDNGCNCIPKQCSCCIGIDYEQFSFNHFVCVNATYNAENIGLDLSVGVDGHYLTEEISVRNPPPICLDVPYTKEIADLCVAFKRLDLSHHLLSGCVELELTALHLHVLRAPLGCFRMPI